MSSRNEDEMEVVEYVQERQQNVIKEGETKPMRERGRGTKER